MQKYRFPERPDYPFASYIHPLRTFAGFKNKPRRVPEGMPGIRAGGSENPVQGSELELVLLVPGICHDLCCR